MAITYLKDIHAYLLLYINVVASKHGSKVYTISVLRPTVFEGHLTARTVSDIRQCLIMEFTF